MNSLRSQWSHRWLHPGTTVFESEIAGLGVRATQSITAGDVVGVIGGVVVPRSKIDEYRAEMGHVGIQIHHNFFIVPETREEVGLTGAFNHCCMPNIGFEAGQNNMLVAIRDIGQDEELMFDYAFSESYFPAFACNCPSERCRETITQDDWKLLPIQKRYGRFFSPYLQLEMS